MSKHDVILRNLRALTGKSSLAAAARVLEPVAPIHVADRRKHVSCQLCGTRFGRGAWLRRPRRAKRICVGGTCLESLVEGRFGDASAVRSAKRAVRRTLERAYQGTLDPGAWITWIAANAPSRYGPAVVELETIGAVRRTSDLRALVKFHDARRKFPAEAFFQHLREMRHVVDVPEELTIDQAIALQQRITPDEDLAVRTRVALALGRAKRDHHVDDVVRDTWERLSSSGRQTVTALIALHEVGRKAGEPFCPSEIAAEWPLAPRALLAESYLWSPFVGLVHVDPDTDTVGDKVWFYDGAYAGRKVSLLDYRDVQGGSASGLRALQRLAGQRLAPSAEGEAQFSTLLSLKRTL